MLLKVQNITKRFGGLTAVSNLSFSLQTGEILGLIGPNGAGKTTFMNLLGGIFPVDSGSMEFDGLDITNKTPHEICRLGISRTFQIPRPFPDLTALLNVAIGALCGKKRPNMSFTDALLNASHCLEFFGLFGKRNVLARDMTLYELRLLEMARAVATTPKLILIDEVMAGLNPAESVRAIDLIRQMIEEYHVTIIWIEHVMKIIMEATDRVVVLHQGEKLTSGPPLEVANDPKVIKSYLGKEYV